MNKQRLLKLADFLEKLPPKKFDYSTIVSGNDMPRKDFGCGSTACAIGWCPVVFPKELKYARSYLGDFRVTPKRGIERNSFDTAGRFFGLTFEETCGLFDPNNQRPIGERNLSERARATTVAALIRRFVAKKEKA